MYSYSERTFTGRRVDSILKHVPWQNNSQGVRKRVLAPPSSFLPGAYILLVTYCVTDGNPTFQVGIFHLHMLPFNIFFILDTKINDWKRIFTYKTKVSCIMENMPMEPMKDCSYLKSDQSGLNYVLPLFGTEGRGRRGSLRQWVTRITQLRIYRR